MRMKMDDYSSKRKTEILGHRDEEIFVTGDPGISQYLSDDCVSKKGEPMMLYLGVETWTRKIQIPTFAYFRILYQVCQIRREEPNSRRLF